jgi:dienelactone hydrolase
LFRTIFVTFALCLVIPGCNSPSLSVLDPVDGRDVASPGPAISLLEYTALRVKNQTPTSAEGVIYYIDGTDVDMPVRDDFRATFPYIFSLNQRHGWNIISAKFPESAKHADNAAPRAAAFLKNRVTELKAQGYKRVIVGGQSWGAWVSLIAASQNSAGAIDGLLMAAPGRYRGAVVNGAPNPKFIKNKTEFLELLQTVSVPTALLAFKNDPIDPGGRSAEAERVLTTNQVAHLIIDQPAKYTGHGVAWYPMFDFEYGGCIGSFLKKARTMRCPSPPPLSNTDSRSILTKKQIAEASATSVIVDDLNGKAFVATRSSSLTTHRIYSEGNVTINDGEKMESFSVSTQDGKVCMPAGCLEMYRLQDGAVVAFDETGSQYLTMYPVK